MVREKEWYYFIPKFVLVCYANRPPDRNDQSQSVSQNQALLQAVLKSAMREEETQGTNNDENAGCQTVKREFQGVGADLCKIELTDNRKEGQASVRVDSKCQQQKEHILPK